MNARTWLRYGAYPVVIGGTAVSVTLVAAGRLAAWPALLVTAAIGIALVTVFEAVQPYELIWRRDHGDRYADLAHGIVNLGLLAGMAYALHALRDILPAPHFWPSVWPAWAQVLLAGAVIDVGLYAMHRFSHEIRWAWRLHAIHHASERLYWLNGERRHPLSALLMAGPGLIVVTALGAPAEIISAWLTLLSVHLAFQHANLDYTVGPLRRWLGVAEVHRWHHKRDHEDAQVNFGEFWMVWDRLFGTLLDQPQAIRAGDVGLRAERMPLGYVEQLTWPFQRRRASRASRAFARALADGDAALRAGEADRAFARYERAHVLGQSQTIQHVRSHLAFLRWAWQQRDMPELLGQLFRIIAAALFTWLWMPRGNTGGARANAFRSMPIPDDLITLMKDK